MFDRQTRATKCSSMVTVSLTKPCSIAPVRALALEEQPASRRHRYVCWRSIEQEAFMNVDLIGEAEPCM
jgi:hypothetical protein